MASPMSRPPRREPSPAIMRRNTFLSSAVSKALPFAALLVMLLFAARTAQAQYVNSTNGSHSGTGVTCTVITPTGLTPGDCLFYVLDSGNASGCVPSVGLWTAVNPSSGWRFLSRCLVTRCHRQRSQQLHLHLLRQCSSLRLSRLHRH